MVCGVFVVVFPVVVAVVVVWWVCLCVCSWCSCGLPMFFFMLHLSPRKMSVRQDVLEYVP